MSDENSIAAKWAKLTDREREVATLKVQTGRLNKQIAHDLGICEKTVKVHLGRAMDKLGVRGIVALVRAVDAALAA